MASVTVRKKQGNVNREKIWGFRRKGVIDNFLK